MLAAIKDTLEAMTPGDMVSLYCTYPILDNQQSIRHVPLQRVSNSHMGVSSTEAPYLFRNRVEGPPGTLWAWNIRRHFSTATVNEDWREMST